MRSRTSKAKLAIMVFPTVASLNSALAQSAQPGLYAYHTGPAVGGCPGLDWHIVLGADSSLTGFVTWDQGEHMAKLAGSIKKDRTFEMDAQEVGGVGKKATVK